MQKTLVLIRHAQASNEWGIDDIKRPLTPLGHTQAAHLGRVLANANIRPEHIYVSPATRTQETLHEILNVLPIPHIHTHANLYLPDGQTVHELTYEHADAACIAVLIHEPAVSERGSHYAKDNTELAWGVPVATALVLRWEGQWEDLGSHMADLEIFCGSE